MNTSLQRALGAARVVAGLWDRPELSDVELLERFTQAGDSEAFADLVRRHGKAVLAASRHVLPAAADVEDVFQATFLLLLQKVEAVDGTTVRSWLYAVAHRLAVRARADAHRRAERERAAAQRRRVESSPPDLSWREAVAALHEELDRLPDRYRLPLLHCHLAGLSREEAAARLGWRPGAVKGCLERGRKLLASRLARRGITPSVGLLAAVTGSASAAGGPPAALVQLTLRAATGTASRGVTVLVQGALSMTNAVKKGIVITLAAAGLVVAVLGMGLAKRAFVRQPPDVVTRALPDAPGADLEGEWLVVEMHDKGRKQPTFKVRAEQVRFVFERGEVAMRGRDGVSALPPGTKLHLDPARSPKHIDIIVPPGGKVKGGRLRGIYAVEADRLRLSFNFQEASPRPTAFRSGRDGEPAVYEMVRLHPGPTQPGPVHPADELGAVLRDWDRADQAYRKAWQETAAPAALSRAREARSARAVALAERCLGIAEKDTDGPAGLAALCRAAWTASKSPAGRKALALLKAGRVGRASLDDLFDSLDGLPGDVEDNEQLEELGRLVLARTKRELDHPRAARLLSWVCSLALQFEGAEPPDFFAPAADLLIPRFAARPDIEHFCECFGTSSPTAPPWAARYERHLRAILKENKHRHIRAFARFALARTLQLGGEKRQAEAVKAYEQYLKEFDGSDPTWGTEKRMRNAAEHELDVIRRLSPGGPAPEIEGVDLDGRAMNLSDFKGKVVLLSFWGTWCAPCMNLVPAERALLDRFKGKPFALVGVNSDPLKTDLRTAVKEHQITWRSFKDKQPGKPRIDAAYKVRSWPTLYLIDQAGVIRGRWPGTPNLEVLDREIDTLVREAESKR